MRKLILAAIVAAAFSIPAFAAEGAPAAVQQDGALAAAPAAQEQETSPKPTAEERAQANEGQHATKHQAKKHKAKSTHHAKSKHHAKKAAPEASAPASGGM